VPRLLVLPLVVALLGFAVYPLVYLLALSASRSQLGDTFQRWVGLQNYRDALADGAVTGALARTVLFAVPVSLAELVVGVAIALLIQSSLRRGQVIRALILLPLMTPPVMVAVAWRLILNPAGGLLNGVLLDLGLVDRPVTILGSTRWAFPAVGLADAWQWTPFVILLAFAALQTQPVDVAEAAQADGASPWRAFWDVTFPMLLPALVAIGLLRLVMAFKVFDLVYLLTFGGPGDATSLASFQIWRLALREFNVGAAAAQTVLFALLVGVVTLPVTLLRDWALRRTS